MKKTKSTSPERQTAPCAEILPADEIKELLFEDICKDVMLLDPNLPAGSKYFKTAVVLIAAMFVTGPSPDQLVSFTGYPPDFVQGISQRMHEATYWQNGEIDREWSIPDDIWMDVLAAQGDAHVCVLESGDRICWTPGKKFLEI